MNFFPEACREKRLPDRLEGKLDELGENRGQKWTPEGRFALGEFFPIFPTLFRKFDFQEGKYVYSR
jgi:hypothetical protein